MVARMCLNVTLYVCTLPVLFCFFPSIPSSPQPLCSPSPTPSPSCCMLSHHVILCDLRYNTVQLFNTFSIKNLFHLQETAMKQSVYNNTRGKFSSHRMKHKRCNHSTNTTKKQEQQHIILEFHELKYAIIWWISRTRYPCWFWVARYGV